MELALYSMFKINLENLVKNKLHICKNYNIQPSEIDRLWFFDYETFIREINTYQKKEEEQQKKQEEQQQKSMPDVSGMIRSQQMQQNTMMSNFSSPSLPTVSLPKF